MTTINFKGKNAVWNHHLSVPYQILEKDNKLSLTGNGEDDNLIIEADNLIALKSLLPKYQGKIRCIYIDPPYNLPNGGWSYNDKVNSPLIKDWIGKTVNSDDLTRHDKWLCMMTPRLKLLYELLEECGAVFISIDDNEQHRLKALMDEIFGEDNFIANFSWRRKKEISNDAKGIAPKVEYVIAYAKSKETIINRLSLSDDYVKKTYSNPNKDPRGDWRPVSIKLSVGHQGGGYKYKITTPSGKVFDTDWTLPEATFKKLIADNRVYFGKNNDALPQRIIFLNESRGQVQSNLLLDQGTNKEGKNEILDIFKLDVFDTPKPSSLISYLINLVADESSIILDSFAGSGTTAQSVLDVNKIDEGDRKFILIQLPEEIKKDKPAYKAGFKYIHEITRERVKRVIERDKLGIGFSYMKLGPKIDAESILSGDLPTFNEFAKYVFYLATGKTMDDETSIKKDGYSVGKINGETIYLIYENDKEKLKNLAITLDWAKNINQKDNGKKIVYAPACFLDEEYLEKFNISFVSIPYNLFEKK